MLFLKDNMTPRNTATNIPPDLSISTLDDSEDNSELDDLTDNFIQNEEFEADNIFNVHNKTPQKRKHSKRQSYQTESIEIERKKIKLFEDRLKMKKIQILIMMMKSTIF